MSDSLHQNKKKPIAFSIMLLLGVLGIPGLYSGGMISIEDVNMMGRYMTFAIVAIGLDLIWGYTGALSLCQALFFSLGAYCMGMFCAHHGGPEGLIDKTGWKLPACLFVVYPYEVGESAGDALVPLFWRPFWSLPFTIVLGLLVPGFVALVIGFFGFKSRVRGVYFAILTQAITVAAWNFFCMNNMKFCGTNGLTRFKYLCPISHPPGTRCHPDVTSAATIHEGVRPFDLADPNVQLTLYFITVFCLVGVYLIAKVITNSRLGRVLIAVRDDENTLRFSGYDPANYKIFIYVISAMFAGLGGMLYAPQMKIFTPEYMTAKWSILVVIWVAVGGRGTLSGAVIGALAVNLIYNFLTSRWPDSWPFVQGALFLVVVLFVPDGIMGIPQRIKQLMGSKPTGEAPKKEPITEATVS
jgi:urea transport system permease protein